MAYLRCVELTVHFPLTSECVELIRADGVEHVTLNTNVVNVFGTEWFTLMHSLNMQVRRTD